MADNLLDKASILLTPTAYNDGSMLSIKPENGDGDFDFQRSGNASRVNSSGNVVTESANIPRIDYTDGCGSWLLEPQSTNLITQGNDLSNWSFGRTTRTITDGINPDGTTEKVLVLATSASNGTHRCYSNSTAIIPNEDYTISVYVKKGTASKIEMELKTLSESPDGFGECVFDINNETITNGKFEVFNDDWYRIQSTGSLNTSTSGIIFMYIYNEDGDRSYVATGNENLYLWGVQLEQQSYATSYIPTNGSIATRLADIANNSGNSSLINSTEGVLYAEIAALADDLNIEGISISDGSISNRVVIFKWSNSNSIRARVSSNGINVLNQTFSVSDITDFNKIAISYKLNEFKVYINGTNVFNGTSGAVPIGLNTLSFDTDGTSFTPFYGNTKDLKYYPKALADVQLEDLTTITLDTIFGSTFDITFN